MALFLRWQGAPGHQRAPSTQSDSQQAFLLPVEMSADADYDEAVQLMRESKWSEAKPLFDKVLRAKPGNTIARYNRAACLQNLMHWDEAISDFSSVLRTDPKNTAALYNRAICNMNLERLQEALADLNAVIEIKPTPSAYINRAKVRAALGDSAGAKADERRAHELSHIN